MPAGARDGRAFDPFVLRERKESLPFAGTSVDLQDARNGIDFVTRFDYITKSLLVKTAMDGRVKSTCHHFGDIALWQQDIVRVIVARSFPADLDLFQHRQDRLVEIRQPIRQHGNEFFFCFHLFLHLSSGMNL